MSSDRTTVLPGQSEEQRYMLVVNFTWGPGGRSDRLPPIFDDAPDKFLPEYVDTGHGVFERYQDDDGTYVEVRADWVVGRSVDEIELEPDKLDDDDQIERDSTPTPQDDPSRHER